jgi:8-oxo-dGTP pyrophosphatase MutT (NUDIX family)
MALDAGLSSQLRHYRPSDARETELVRRMQDLLALPAPFSRSSFEPGHFTASAFVLSPDRTRVLLVFHNKLRLLLQPGGHVDVADESLARAARREVSEEVGLVELAPFAGEEAIFDLDVHRIPPRPAEPAHEHFDVRFAFVARSCDVRLNKEVRDPRWVGLGEIEAVATDESVVRAVKKLRAR